MTDEFEARVTDKMLDIAFGAGEVIVDANDIMPIGEQPVAEVRPKKSPPPVTSIDLTEAI